MSKLIPLTEMIEYASQSGYGEITRLRRTFSQFRSYALIAKYDQKSPRKGGEGLWHPIQLDLFICYLENIKESGTRPGGRYKQDLLQMAASIPVGLWLYGYEGVPLDQAKECLRFHWKGYRKAILKNREQLMGKGVSVESREGRSIQEYVRGISIVPTANRKLAPKVTMLLHDVFIRGSLDLVSRAKWNNVVSLFWDGEPQEDSQFLSDEWRLQIDCFLCGLQYMDNLMKDTAPTDKFWQWARDAYQHANTRWKSTVKAMQNGSPELVEDFVGPVLGTPEFDSDLLYAGREILRFFGIGIKQLRGEINLPKGSGSPRPKPALAAIFE